MLTFLFGKVHKKFTNEFVFINHFESSQIYELFHSMATLVYVRKLSPRDHTHVRIPFYESENCD